MSDGCWRPDVGKEIKDRGDDSATDVIVSVPHKTLLCFFTVVVVFGDDDDERAEETIADLAGCVKFRGSLCRPGGFV